MFKPPAEQLTLNQRVQGSESLCAHQLNQVSSEGVKPDSGSRGNQRGNSSTGPKARHNRYRSVSPWYRSDPLSVITGGSA